MKKRLFSGILTICLLCTNSNFYVQAANMVSYQDEKIDATYSAASIDAAISAYELALAKHQSTIQIILANHISYQDFWNALKSLLEKHTRTYSNFNVDTMHIEINNHIATLYTTFYTTLEEEQALDLLYRQLHTQTAGKTEYEKIKFMYHYICQAVSYDDATLSNLANERSAYDGLIEGKTVCCGYALAFQRFMEQENIPCYIICGETPDGPHAWNVVCIDGQWYHLDATWDDVGNSCSYTYFLLGTDSIPFSYAYSDMTFRLAPTSYSAPAQK